MHAKRMEIEGNSLIGLYIIPLKEKVIVGTELTEQQMKDIEEIFDAKAVVTTFAGTPLVGVFGASNGEKIVVPHILFDHEKEILKKEGIEFKVVKSDLTCHGNNIVATTKGLVVNPEYDEKAIKEFEAFFSTTAQPFTFEKIPSIGSFVVCNSTHGISTHNFSEKTLQKLSDILGVVITTSTVNMGSTQVKSGIAVNDSGFIIGEHSGGPEVVSADEALGFLEDE
ncbi:MAG: hypothetical protein ACQESC_01960 [Nanobdellota archaeon]